MIYPKKTFVTNAWDWIWKHQIPGSTDQNFTARTLPHPPMRQPQIKASRKTGCSMVEHPFVYIYIYLLTYIYMCVFLNKKYNILSGEKSLLRDMLLRVKKPTFRLELALPSRENRWLANIYRLGEHATEQLQETHECLRNTQVSRV